MGDDRDRRFPREVEHWAAVRGEQLLTLGSTQDFVQARLEGTQGVVLQDASDAGGDTARRQGLQKDLRALVANIRADAEGRYAGADPGWQAGVEWTLLWVENTASQLTEGRP